MAGDLDEPSEAIGGLKVGVVNLERALREHSRRDEEYRRERDRKFDEFQDKAMAALGKLDGIVTTQSSHANKIESLETSRTRLRATLAAIGTAGTAIATAAGLLFQWITSPGSGQ